MSSLPYHEIPVPSERVSAGTVLARFVDGLGFRYRWATEGLRSEDLDFNPGAECMSLRKLLQHVLGLVGFADACLGGSERGKPGEIEDLETLREQTLVRTQALSDRLKEMDDGTLAGFAVPRKGEEPLPFWYMLNGPLADALTHVGQINTWRRLNGNPWPSANVFMGKPPAGK